jgi:hypothetical protein
MKYITLDNRTSMNRDLDLDQNKLFHLKPDDARKIFHGISDDAASRLIFNDEALFSVTPTDQAEFTYEIVLRYLKSSEISSLTDAGGGFGGNILTFARHIPHVNYVDIKSTPIFERNFEILTGENPRQKNNYNIDVYTADYAKIYDSLDQDVVFMDPPWGGPEYRSVTRPGHGNKPRRLHLYYGGVNVIDIARDLLSKNKAKLILIKAPFNYHVQYSDLGPVKDMIHLYLESIPLLRPDGKMLYKIIIISKTPPKYRTYPKFRLFPPLGYKSMKGLKGHGPFEPVTNYG